MLRLGRVCISTLGVSSFLSTNLRLIQCMYEGHFGHFNCCAICLLPCSVWRATWSLTKLRLGSPVYLYIHSLGCFSFQKLFSIYTHDIYTRTASFEFSNTRSLVAQITAKTLPIFCSGTRFRILESRAFYSYQNINDPSLFFVRVFSRPLDF